MRIERGEPIVCGYKEAYVAFDGTSFDKAWKCRDYEESILLESAEKTMEHSHSWIPLDGDEHMDNDTYYWFKPKKYEDIDVLNELFNCINYSEEEREEFNKHNLEEWCCIESNGDGMAWTSTLGLCVRRITSFLTDFGYDVKIEPKKEDNNG